MAEQTASPVAALLSDFNTKLRDIEERQRLIKDRSLLIGENLIELKEENNKDIAELKVKADKLEKEMNRMKELLSMLIDESKNYARKSELEILYRQLKMFQPFVQK